MSKRSRGAYIGGHTVISLPHGVVNSGFSVVRGSKARPGTPFVTYPTRLALGPQIARDMIYDAWLQALTRE
jgi:hypothetical protein